LCRKQRQGYDALNRLQTAQENSGASWSQTNGYDRYGNRWIDLGGGVQNLYFNASNNRISGWSYDAAGNLLNDTVHAYTYDAENKISKVDNVAAYVYDGEGHRVRKLVGENTRFVYGIGGQLLAEFDGGTGALKKEYVYGGGSLITIEPTAVNANGTQYTTSDVLGSPRVVTNASASVVSRHDYLPFGEELGAGVGGRTQAQGYSGDSVRQRFTGQERDPETGLDYFINRYHSSMQGRFTSPDPLLASAKFSDPQSWNRYTYCGNNPLVNVDPLGLLWYQNNDSGGLKWFDKDPGEGWKQWTQYSYYAGEQYGWVALDPRSNHYETGFETQGDAAGYSNAMEYVTAMQQDPAHDPHQFDQFMQMQLMLAPVDIAEVGIEALGEEGTELLAKGGIDAALKTAATETATETAQVILNRAAGKGAEAIVAKQLEAEGYTIVGSQVGVRTSQGLRFIDHLVEDPAGNLIAMEVKSGGGVRTGLQVAKDTEMATQGATIVSSKVPRLTGQLKVIPTVVRTVPR